MTETDAVFVYTTWPSPATAEAAGAALVEARLAAAVNIIANVTSIYRWRGAVERAQEAVMVIKTRRSGLAGGLASRPVGGLPARSRPSAECAIGPPRTSTPA